MIKYILLLAVLILGLCAPATRAAEPARIVFMIGEDEYHTWETLPAFADTDLKPLGYRITIVNADPQDKNNFPGIVEALHDADLLFLSVRRRTPPQDQLDAVRAYLAAGKPLVGIRTACHAFALRPTDKIADPKLALWQEFDPEVIGGHYTGHHGAEKVTITIATPGAETRPILKGVDIARLIGNGGLYKVSPLAPDSVPLLTGAIAGEPAEPVAWTHYYGPKGRVFYTSLGHPEDFQNPEFHRFLVNAVAWALGPKAK